MIWVWALLAHDDHMIWSVLADPHALEGAGPSGGWGAQSAEDSRPHPEAKTATLYPNLTNLPDPNLTNLPVPNLTPDPVLEHGSGSSSL